MKFRCVDSTGLEGILQTGKVYAGELANHGLYLHIFRGEDKHPVNCSPSRFVPVVELLDDTEVKINSFCLVVE